MQLARPTPYTICFALLSFALGCRWTTSSGPVAIDAALRARCVNTLRETMKTEPRWVKVHAGEFLVSLDYREGVREVFELELAEHGTEPEYRIGVWRVLAQLDRHDAHKFDLWVRKIGDAFWDVDGPDRIHAAESLAKLAYQLPRRTSGPDQDDEWTAVRQFAENGPSGGRAYARWMLLNNGDPTAEAELAAMLSSTDGRQRRAAAYCLRHQPQLEESSVAALRAAYEAEPAKSSGKVYLLTGLLKHDIRRDPDRTMFEAALLETLASGLAEEQFEASRGLADFGDDSTQPLIKLLDDPAASADVRASVAHALCRIGRRATPRMGAVDWGVVCVYGLVMLGIGGYYSRQSRTTEEYLLGGRVMRSWTVGLSLFATLLSTLSYLAWPGEMIKHGPIVLMGICAYPLVFVVAGWLLIPQIVKLHVTSAYEILEDRFGLSVRLLGAFLFLSLRLLWMASILYWTSVIVLLPAAGLDQPSAPYVAFVLGAITIAYTSMGGLRAVVMTDVLQTFVLLAGAIAALLLINRSLGGVPHWFPDHWAAHWTEPRIWFDFTPGACATVANAMLSVFFWHVCTAGSDQMAIQRYLSTRNVQSARRTLAISLLTDFAVVVMLGLLGLALLAFFSLHPDRLRDGQSLYANADKLFPRFVLVGLPTGFSGLVIAGLLAAAMSSLSSGINSSSAVISQDVFGRLGKTTRTDAQQVRLARTASIFIGLTAVGLSTVIGLIQGNMLEVVYKVVNLFVAPLFLLFFMAIFIPWSTTFGTWTGAIAAVATAIMIAFWGDFTGSTGLSFLWIMPGSLAAGIIVASLASAGPRWSTGRT